MVGGSLRTTRNTKLLARGLRVGARRVALEENSAHAVPVGARFRAQTWAFHTGESIFGYPKKKIREKTCDSKSEVAFYKR